MIMLFCREHFQVHFHSADVRDPSAISEAISVCERELGLPNIIVNNAAGNFISPTERLSPNAFKTIVDIVLLGTANVTLEVSCNHRENFFLPQSPVSKYIVEKFKTEPSLP